MDTKSEQGLVCQARGEATRMQAEGDGVLPFRRCAQQDRQEADHTAAELIDALTRARADCPGGHRRGATGKGGPGPSRQSRAGPQGGLEGDPWPRVGPQGSTCVVRSMDVGVLLQKLSFTVC